MLGLLGLAVAAAPAVAHEFWLDAVDYTPKVGEEVPIVHRSGQNFLGDSFPFLKEMTRRYIVADAKGVRPVKAVEGDDPAADITFPNAGLAIVAFEGNPDSITFETLERFEDVIKEEGLEHIVEQHAERKLAPTNIRELYARCAKALIKVGAGVGSDRPVGMPLEIVAEQNPYSLKAGEPLSVRVLYQGKPVPGIMIKSFHLKDKQSPRRVRTDADGRARIELPIKGEYLLNAVHMLPHDKPAEADWISYWASMTFKRP
jgi:hypothetical protein